MSNDTPKIYTHVNESNWINRRTRWENQEEKNKRERENGRLVNWNFDVHHLIDIFVIKWEKKSQRFIYSGFYRGLQMRSTWKLYRYWARLCKQAKSLQVLGGRRFLWLCWFDLIFVCNLWRFCLGDFHFNLEHTHIFLTSFAFVSLWISIEFFFC